jgi:hypothetical protein
MTNLERDNNQGRGVADGFSLPFGHPWGGGIYSQRLGWKNYMKVPYKTKKCIQRWFLLPWFWRRYFESQSLTKAYPMSSWSKPIQRTMVK